MITGKTPYVFCNQDKRKPQPISETIARKCLHELGYKGIHCLHGFRSLATTVLNAESSFRADAIEAQQARKTMGVRGIYLRADFKHERRCIMEWFSRWLLTPIKEKT